MKEETHVGMDVDIPPNTHMYVMYVNYILSKCQKCHYISAKEQFDFSLIIFEISSSYSEMTSEIGIRDCQMIDCLQDQSELPLAPKLMALAPPW